MLLLLFICILGVYAVCNKNDAAIFKNQGSTFEARFRAFGGAFTFHGGFRQKVMDSTGLSESCAECYALAYDCGKNNCWASCAIGKGARCDRCLQKYKCQENCNKCTKFL
jgi:hypothetical protein